MKMSQLGNILVAAGALSAACGALSVLVVLRRWAFIGEGIGHAGFGGVGLAWLLSLALPAMAEPSATYAMAVGCSLLTAMGIGWVSRRSVPADTAIGVFLVAALAVGFLAQAIYRHIHHAFPPNWEVALAGELHGVSLGYALAAVGLAAGVLLVLVALGKEIISYCFDPVLAQSSGVRVGAIHYLLIGLVALTIVFAMKLMGPLLVTALLILPGAAALQLSRKMRQVMFLAVGLGMLAAVAGALVRLKWAFVPPGPAMAMALLLEFAVAYAISPQRRARPV